MNFAFIVTPDSLTFVDPSTGLTHSIVSSNVAFIKAKEILKQMKNIDDEEKNKLISELVILASPAKILEKNIEAHKESKVTIRDGVLYYNGEEIHSVVSERILWGIEEGYDMNPYIMFLEKLMLNTSYKSINQLYNFIEVNKMGIADDGDILGYKKVKNDYYDIYSGKFCNNIGAIIEMPRNKVSDDSNSTCSAGLHFCAQSYLKSYGSSSGQKIMIVKVNPKDVVSIPVDHANAKARCCRYEVVGEYTGDKDILGEHSVFDEKSIRSNFNDSYDYDEDEDDDDDEFSDDCPDKYSPGKLDSYDGWCFLYEDNNYYKITGYADGYSDVLVSVQQIKDESIGFYIRLQELQNNYECLPISEINNVNNIVFVDDDKPEIDTPPEPPQATPDVKTPIQIPPIPDISSLSNLFKKM